MVHNIYILAKQCRDVSHFLPLTCTLVYYIVFVSYILPRYHLTNQLPAYGDGWGEYLRTLHHNGTNTNILDMTDSLMKIHKLHHPDFLLAHKSCLKC